MSPQPFVFMSPTINELEIEIPDVDTHSFTGKIKPTEVQIKQIAMSGKGERIVEITDQAMSFMAKGRILKMSHEQDISSYTEMRVTGYTSQASMHSRVRFTITGLIKNMTGDVRTYTADKISLSMNGKEIEGLTGEIVGGKITIKPTPPSYGQQPRFTRKPRAPRE